MTRNQYNTTRPGQQLKINHGPIMPYECTRVLYWRHRPPTLGVYGHMEKMDYKGFSSQHKHLMCMFSRSHTLIQHTFAIFPNLEESDLKVSLNISIAILTLCPINKDLGVNYFGLTKRPNKVGLIREGQSNTFSFEND